MTSSAAKGQLPDDPSVLYYGEEGSEAIASDGGALQQGLEPGNVLSKLLDSAMAKAAKETTPDLDSSDLSGWDIQVQGNISGKKYVYSITDLFRLKSTADKSIQQQLPEKGFWRARVKFGANSTQSREGKQSRKTSANKKYMQDTWERKPGSLKSNIDNEGTNTERNAESLEDGDEPLPEWDTVNLNDEMNIDMGSTVEDFENWKAHMRREDLRKAGEPLDEISSKDYKDSGQAAKRAGNEVDNFFSFIKPKSGDTKSTSPVKSFNGSQTPQFNNNEIGKSSRFSSFFTSSQETPNTTPGGLANNSPVISDSKGSGKGSGKGSKFFHGQVSSTTSNIENGPTVSAPSQSAPNLPNMVPVSNVPNVPYSHDIQHIHNVRSIENQPAVHPGNVRGPFPPPPMNNESTNSSSGNTNSKDSFFMALLNKAESSTKPNDAPPFAGLSQNIERQGSGSIPSQAKVSPKEIRNAVTPLQQNDPKQTTNMPYKGQNNSQIPPWMQQTHNSVPPPNMPPNYQFNPNVSGRMVPPPGFVPPGFMPPPGMPMRGPQGFGNERSPMQFPPPHMMHYPPGLPTPEVQQQNIDMVKNVYQQHHPQQR